MICYLSPVLCAGLRMEIYRCHCMIEIWLCIQFLPVQKLHLSFSSFRQIKAIDAVVPNLIFHIFRSPLSDILLFINIIQ